MTALFIYDIKVDETACMRSLSMACALHLQIVTHSLEMSHVGPEWLLFTLKFSTYFCAYKAVYEFVFDIQD